MGEHWLATFALLALRIFLRPCKGGHAKQEYKGETEDSFVQFFAVKHDFTLAASRHELLQLAPFVAIRKALSIPSLDVSLLLE